MKKILGVLFMVCSTVAMAADLPLKDVTIFSSGVAFFEHELTLSGSATFELSFDEEQVDDFLKSLAISDAGAKKISLEYSSSDTLQKTLESLQVDLSTRPSIYELLKNQLGSNMSFEIFNGTTARKLEGRILTIEKLVAGDKNSEDLKLSVLTQENAVYVFNMSEVQSFKFTDANKNEALAKAMQLLNADNTSQNKKTICIKIDGAGERNVKLSYILGAPVWKTTYRLILGNKEAVFQAWAIVDNSTNMDWKNIKLNLVTGRPVSFKQNLYEPYYVARPEIPLPIEGAASLEMYDSALAESKPEANLSRGYESERKMLKSFAPRYADAATTDESYELNEEVFAADASVRAGAKFVFTPSAPVSLERQKSLMLPLKVTTLPAKKMTVFSGLGNQPKNPKLCVELTNTSGMNLPAGAVTLYDDGYSGDSMLAFLPKDEKRLISYGDDLLLSAFRMSSKSETISKLSAESGVLKVEVERIYTSTYKFKNADQNQRTVILEHPINRNASLYKTQKPVEQTANDYRFEVNIPATASADLVVSESIVLYNQYSLIDRNMDSRIFEYLKSGKAPANVVAIFKDITARQSRLDAISKKLSESTNQLKKLESEQERVRKNMEALAGTSEVTTFTKKLFTLEEEIVLTNNEIEKTQNELRTAENDFKTFLQSLKF